MVIAALWLDRNLLSSATRKQRHELCFPGAVVLRINADAIGRRSGGRGYFGEFQEIAERRSGNRSLQCQRVKHCVLRWRNINHAVVDYVRDNRLQIRFGYARALPDAGCNRAERRDAGLADVCCRYVEKRTASYAVAVRY